MSARSFLGRRLHEIFQARAAEMPERIAVSCGDARATYAELDGRANAVADELLAKGVSSGNLVGLCVDRSVELIVGMLGILKANAGYVPLDPTYPAKRLRWIAENSGVRTVVVGSGASLELVPDAHVRVEVPSSGAAVTAARERPGEHDTAYVIYTSGSTGTPKGVVVEHANVVSLFAATEDTFAFGADDVWSLFHSVGFDFSVWEIWGALLYGGRLAIVPFSVSRSPQQFRQFLLEQKVSILNQTPSAFRGLSAADLARTAKLTSLRHVVFGGERLDVELLRPWFAKYGDEHPMMHNMYGITESTIHTTYRRLRSEDAAKGGASPIGRPLQHLAIHLVDEQLKPVRSGDAGEILVEGAGVAREYLNNPELTAKKFPTLAIGKASRRVYRSGDRAVLRGGEYFYLGRIDDQFKVRGYRIEPHEIEACLAHHPSVAAVAAMPRDFGAGDARIVAFVVPRAEHKRNPEGGKLLERGLAALAAQSLPSFMRPSKFICLEHLPLTEHGKIDRSKLAEIPLSAAEGANAASEDSDGNYQDALAAIWGEILAENVTDVDADFFDSGGTSLALLRMLSSVEKRFGVSIEPSAFVDGVTMRAIESVLRSNGLQLPKRMTM